MSSLPSDAGDHLRSNLAEKSHCSAVVYFDAKVDRKLPAMARLLLACASLLVVSARM